MREQRRGKPLRHEQSHVIWEGQQPQRFPWEAFACFAFVLALIIGA